MQKLLLKLRGEGALLVYVIMGVRGFMQTVFKIEITREGCLAYMINGVQ